MWKSRGNNVAMGNKNVDKPKKKKKKKRSKKWLFIPVLIGVIVALFVFNGSETQSVNIFKEVELLREEKKPFAIIITNTNSNVARDEEKNIEAIKKGAPGRLNVFSVDRAKGNVKEGNYFIDMYQVMALPAVIVCNGQGEAIKVFGAPFNVEEIINTMNTLPLEDSEE